MPSEGKGWKVELVCKIRLPPIDADYIVTFNIRDFIGVEAFGIQAIRPGAFLRLLEEMP